MKKFSVILVLMMMVLMSACSQGGKEKSSGNESDSDVVKIGLINPMTGDAAAWGQYSVEAAELVIKEVNDAGGILGGKKVELVVADSKGSPEDTTKEMNKLISQDKVAAIVGSSFSTAALAGRDVTKKEQILYMVTGAKHPDVTDQGHDLLFRVNTTQSQDGKGFLKIIKEDMKIKTIAIISDQTDYGYFYKDMLEKELPGMGIEIVASDEVPFSTSDFSTQMTNYKSKKPDAVAINLGSPPTAAAFLKQMKEFGFDSEKILMGGNVDATLIDLSGETIEDSWLVDIYVDGLENEENTKFIDGLKARGSKAVTKLHLQTYDGMRVVLEAIEKAGSTDSKKVADAIRSSSFASPRGSELKFDEKGQVQAELVSITIRDGKIVPR
jgi:branched-chain amino acid transport system substrate-binding protein